jgi:hypothetical protein
MDAILRGTPSERSRPMFKQWSRNLPLGCRRGQMRLFEFFGAPPYRRAFVLEDPEEDGGVVGL